jgi:quercetin dioxygenase-like cupin family protein
MLGKLDLDTEIVRYPPSDGASGRRAETLIKTDRLRVVLITMRAGASLQKHVAHGPITIQALRGRFVITVAGEESTLATGELMVLEGATPHAVRAEQDGAFLLTLVWDPSWHGRSGGHAGDLGDATGI